MEFCVGFATFLVVGIGTSIAVLVAALAHFGLSKNGLFLSWSVLSCPVIVCFSIFIKHG